VASDGREDPFSLSRFVQAQDAGGAYERALAELRAGRKRSHWMWFVFPQLAGLGHSEMARRYALGSLDEARAFLEHPLLGPRLLACTRALTELPASPPREVVEILGAVDALKLRSSMTLFARAARDGRPFADVLDRFFAGERDDATERLLDARRLDA